MNNKLKQELIPLLKFDFKKFDIATTDLNLTESHVKSVLGNLISNLPLNGINNINYNNEENIIENGINVFYSLNFMLNNYDPMLFFENQKIYLNLKTQNIKLSEKPIDQENKHYILFKDLLSTKNAFLLKEKLKDDNDSELILENYSQFAQNIIDHKIYLTTTFIN